MRIAFLGAARTVTGSQHLLSVNGHKLLLDCGLYQGTGKEAEEINGSFDFEPAELDAVILSHAHIDHSGNLPKLVKDGYRGPIFTTQATAHLCDVMLRDSAHIQELEAEEAGQENGRGKYTPAEPLYTQEDAGRVKEHFRPVEYQEAFEPVPGVTASLQEAGHILGSAAVLLEVEEKGNRQRVWFSGDIGRRNLPLIRNPVLPDQVDTLIMECTYGDQLHEDPLEAINLLRQVMLTTFSRGGKVIIPAFAVGRTQEIVYDLHQMIERKEIPQVPVFVDSPLAVEASEIFIQHPEYFDDEARSFIQTADSRKALGFDLLTYVDSIEQSREIDRRDEPMVIISASGMVETGRILHHVRHHVEDPRCTILIVSWQAPNTLGRALVNGDPKVKIRGQVYERKADVVQIGGLSAHAGQKFLVEYAQAVHGQAKQVFLVHGEEKPAEVLRAKLKEAGLEKVYYPYLRQTMEIGE